MENIKFPHARPLPFLSLKELTVIKLATNLINNQKLLILIMDFEEDLQSRFYAKMGEEWKAVQSMANELLSKICNCAELKEMILELLWPLFYRIMMWRNSFAPSTGNNSLHLFYWTARGRIDNIRTAKYIIGSNNISIREKFTIACCLCLRKEIYKLWSQMSNDDRYFFLQDFEEHESIRPLLCFWVHTMQRYPAVYIERATTDALKCATNFGLLEAIKYLLSTLPEDEKEDSAMLCMDELIEKVNKFCFLEEDDVEISYLLLSEICEENKTAMFSFYAEFTLSFTLHSSEPEFFLKKLEEILPCTSMSDIHTLLHIIFRNYHLEIRKDHDYCKLFVDVWRMIPASARNFITSKPDIGMHFVSVMIKDGLQHLLSTEDFEMAEEHDSSDLEAFTSVTPYCFEEDKWEFLHFLIEEGIVTIPSLTEYRTVFISFLEGKKCQNSQKNKESEDL